YYESEELRSFGFARVGENVRIAKNCVVIGAGNIGLGDDVRVDAFTTIVATTGKLRFEGRNHVGGHTHLCATADLTLGEFAGLSQGVRIYTASDDYGGRALTGPCVPRHLSNATIAPVSIGRHCIVGAGSVILPGCDLHEGAAVGALSLVTRTLTAWTVYHGNPARKVSDRARNPLALEMLIHDLEVIAA
ncbi:MAG: acyltransferase, partial [Oxalobacteraceae bacterium]